jgi:antitoxin YefM
LTALLESLHLLGSPRNAERLFAALEESVARNNLSDEVLADKLLVTILKVINYL